MMMNGSCHCGSIAFEVETDLAQLMRCNCSICGRTGTLMTFVPEPAFKLIRGESSYQDYMFGPKNTHHGFCRTCGVRPYGYGESPNGTMYMVNVGCLEGVDTRDHTEVMVYDGKSR